MVVSLSAMSVTISPNELAHRIHTGKKQTILASFWEPGEGMSYRKFCSEHIPTSLFCDPAASLTSVPSSKNGRNPLPDEETLRRAFAKWGIRDEYDVVVYDQTNSLFAARAWWILKWAGVDNAYILNGGMANWEREGHKIVGGPGNIHAQATRVPSLGHMPVATLEDVKKGDRILIDTREPSRFAGRKEHLDLKAGHIPGAVNVPTRFLMTPEKLFLSPEEVRDQFAQVGIGEEEAKNAIVYSGSGLHGSLGIALMHHAGLPGAAVYMGGWSQWTASGNNPVERGGERTRESMSR